MNQFACEILNQIIVDENLRKEIIDNIDFVEKYLDKVEIFFHIEKEKEIVYKNLGVIVVSCLEAMLKGYRSLMKSNCAKLNCDKENCEYKIEKNFNITPLTKTFNELFNCRIIGGLSDDILEIEDISELRNCIHISKTIEGVDYTEEFNLKFVEKCLYIFYEYLLQLESSISWYLNAKRPCIKELDKNGYQETKRISNLEIKRDKTYEAFELLKQIINNNPQIDKNKIIRLKRETQIEKELLAKITAKELYFMQCRKMEKEAQEFLEETYKRIGEIDQILVEKIKGELEGIIDKYKL